MALLDHFRPPLSNRRHWHSFHNSWATYLSSALNAHLPAGYFAEANVQFGVEVSTPPFDDGGRCARSVVAAFDEGGDPGPPPAYTPRPPDVSVPVALAEATVEVGVFSRSGGPTLAAAIELVSLASKDRPAHRDAIVSKCAAYVRAGVGLVVVDVVTDRAADLHGELLARLGAHGGAGVPLFAAAYRPVERGGAATLDVWHDALAVGSPLPTLPLWLRGGLCLPVELQATYDRTYREQRVPTAA